MISEDLKWIIPVFISILAIPIGWVFKMIWDAIKVRSQLDIQSMKELISEIKELKVAIVRLETQMSAMEKVIYMVQKHDKDLYMLHNKVREITKASASP